MERVKPKKFLGQHFLKDTEIAKRIVESLDTKKIKYFLEIGPGMGILTQYLLKLSIPGFFIEIDKDSAKYLNKHYPSISEKLILADFIKINLHDFNSQIGIIGNFPYNISSQILFKVIENRQLIDQLVGMFQLEVGERICAKPGNKTYGIISVLTQAYFHTELIFKLDPSFFFPQPKVNSAVIKLSNKKIKRLDCDEKLFFNIVKISFQQRRKTLKNSLKVFNVPNNIKEHVIFERRPETLNVEDFVLLTNIIADGTIPAN